MKYLSQNMDIPIKYLHNYEKIVLRSTYINPVPVYYAKITDDELQCLSYTKEIIFFLYY